MDWELAAMVLGVLAGAGWATALWEHLALLRRARHLQEDRDRYKSHESRNRRAMENLATVILATNATKDDIANVAVSLQYLSGCSPEVFEDMHEDSGLEYTEFMSALSDDGDEEDS